MQMSSSTVIRNGFPSYTRVLVYKDRRSLD
jgi:hypothetical protein